MIANSCNLIITARQVNQEKNVRNSRTSGSSSQSTDKSLFGYPLQTEPNIEPKGEDNDQDDIITEDNSIPQKIHTAVPATKSLEWLTQTQFWVWTEQFSSF